MGWTMRGRLERMERERLTKRVDAFTVEGRRRGRPQPGGLCEEIWWEREGNGERERGVPANQAGEQNLSKMQREIKTVIMNLLGVVTYLARVKRCCALWLRRVTH